MLYDQVKDLPAMKIVLESLEKQGVKYKVFDRVVVEPTDISFKEATRWAKEHGFDAYVAVGGGSTMVGSPQ